MVEPFAAQQPAVTRPEQLAGSLARALTLFALVYATWHFGAAHATALKHLSAMLAVSGVLTIFARRSLTPTNYRLPVSLFALCFLWLGYAALQHSVIAGKLPWFFQSVAETRAEFADPAVASLGDAAQRLGHHSTFEPTTRATLMPEETRQAAVPFMLATVIAILASIQFGSRRWRNALLYVVIANAAALSFWGIIQTAGGKVMILPGIENTFANKTPFASFIYKNAGAAAILPPLFASLAILYYRRPSDNDTKWARRDWSWMMKPSNLALGFVAALILAGLATSLSRGAWIAALLALALVALRSGIKVNKPVAIAGAALASIVFAVIAVTGVGGDVKGRADQLSVSSIAGDSRWSHWQEGFATAIAHLPSGSGLGTYGYATLPHQTQTHRSWFREAHNQYLEVLTESGIIGLALMALLLVGFARVAWQLTDRGLRRESRAWGLLGLSLLVCGAFQSLFDFVLVIPANMMLYAALSATVFVLATKHGIRLPQPKAVPEWLGRSVPAWGIVALVLAGFSFHASSDQVQSDRALRLADTSLLSAQPSEEQVASQLEIISQAIANQPNNADLYATRAHWRLAHYRALVLSDSQAQQSGIGWNETKIENIFAILSQQDEASADELRAALLRSAEMRDHVALACEDLRRSISLQPLTPQPHLSACGLAALTEMPIEPWLASSSRLSNNSSMLLYLSGWLAFVSNHDEIAIDQWRKSLSIDHLHLGDIMVLSESRFAPIDIAENLVPADRPELYLELVQDNNQFQTGHSDPTLVATIKHQIHQSRSLDPGRAFSTLARLEQLLGNDSAAAEQWKLALQQRSRDAGYRLEYSRSLHRLGKNDEALRQAVLGQTLNPIDKRFERLAAEIRSEIREQTRR